MKPNTNEQDSTSKTKDESSSHSSQNLDYYQILGLSPNASEKEIRTAYKKRAQKMHPDRGGSEEAFQKLQTAYKTLSDPQRRAIYDCGQRQGINPNEFRTTLTAATNKTINEVLGKLDTRRGGKFDAMIRESLEEQKAEVEALRRQLHDKEELLRRHIKSVKKGQESYLFQALLRRSSELQAALEHLRVSLAVLKFLREDTERLVCELDAEKTFASLPYDEFPPIGSAPWQR